MIKASLIVGLVLINAFIFLYERDRVLTVSFFDVGQGDSIFIEGPTGIQMLIDGGADRSALRELGQTLPFYDRSIDAVVATHPDLDHIGGLPDVFDRYEVGVFVESGVEHETSATKRLEEAAQNENAERVVARAGTRLLLGGGAYADILFPDRSVAGIESNAGSIFMRVVYGESEFMLTGDAPKSIEGYVATMIDHSRLKSDVLKAGHHGSKTSTSEQFLNAVSPLFVVVSAGEDNRYGHPHQDVLGVIENFGAQTLSTIDSGTITFKTNGRTLKLK